MTATVCTVLLSGKSHFTALFVSSLFPAYTGNLHSHLHVESLSRPLGPGNVLIPRGVISEKHLNQSENSRLLPQSRKHWFCKFVFFTQQQQFPYNEAYPEVKKKKITPGQIILHTVGYYPNLQTCFIQAVGCAVTYSVRMSVKKLRVQAYLKERRQDDAEVSTGLWAGRCPALVRSSADLRRDAQLSASAAQIWGDVALL